jgi:hypothetical protein
MAEVIIIEVDCDPALYPQVNESSDEIRCVPNPSRTPSLGRQTPDHRTSLDHPAIPTPDGPLRA